MSTLTQFLKPLVNFVYAEAFHPVAGIASFFGAASTEGKQWWSMAPSSLGAGWMGSVEELKDLCMEEHIDGVLGFSQGAALAAMLVVEMNESSGSSSSSSSSNVAPLFGCFCSGFIPNPPGMCARVDGLLPHHAPTWHCYAHDDEIIREEKSKCLAHCFDKKESLTAPIHAGGHSASKFPVEVLESLRSFVWQQQQSRK